jgi:hypothetical protein
MKLGIMQPYFMPYIGYFQLIAAVDVFIVYDNIKYTKKGWVNRNRMLVNGSDAIFSLPLKKDSDELDVVNRELSSEFNREKLLSQFKGAYTKAPYFNEAFPLLENIIRFKNGNLFTYIHHSINEICRYLKIETQIIISSDLLINHELKAQDKVIALCEIMKADTYINTIGGTELYDRNQFLSHGVKLQFIKAKSFEYSQFAPPFVPWLSIVDVLMFNPIEVVQECINSNYELI